MKIGCTSIANTEIKSRKDTPFDSGRCNRSGDVTSSWILRKAKDFIEKNKCSRITLEDLESVTGCSKYQVIRIFRSQVGDTPHSYIMRRRLAEARRMIARGEPAAEVAAELGFVDQSHLIRRFKSAFGMTPYRFAKNTEGANGSAGAAPLSQPADGHSYRMC